MLQASASGCAPSVSSTCGSYSESPPRRRLAAPTCCSTAMSQLSWHAATSINFLTH